jgi:thiosulfate sulfurtransferase
MGFFFNEINQIDMDQMKTMIQNQDVVVLDVRKEKDYQAAHIEGAVLMDSDLLNSFIQQTDKSSHIICYCYKGISSRNTCQKLMDAGFRHIYNLKGGYDAWCKAS